MQSKPVSLKNMNEPKYKVGDRLKIKHDFDSNESAFIVRSVDRNMITDEFTYSGITDNGGKIHRAIESWVEPT
jgi:hypothetical protein